MAPFEAFWEVACDYRPYLLMAFMLVVFLFILSIISLIFAREGTGAYVISILNFAMISILGIVVAGINYVCAKRARRYY